LNPTLSFYATCPKGLEDLLLQEIQTFPVENSRLNVGAVYFDAPLATAYELCLWSRLANRILLQLNAPKEAPLIASELAPCAAMTFAEVIATSDVPGGVVNILTGSVAEIAPWLASHADVNAIDLTGAERDIAVDCERAAAETLMRVVRPGTFGATESAFNRIAAFVETKTVWHTKSLA
jgi:hypothetical protein